MHYQLVCKQIKEIYQEKAICKMEASRLILFKNLMKQLRYVRKNRFLNKGPITDKVYAKIDKKTQKSLKDNMTTCRRFNMIKAMESRKFFNLRTMQLFKQYKIKTKKSSDNDTIITKNLLYDLPENVQHIIHKFSFNNVINEMNYIFIKKKRKFINKFVKLRESSRYYNNGLKIGMINMIEYKAFKVFMSARWDDVKWYSSASLYTNSRYNNIIYGFICGKGEIVNKVYSCAFLNSRVKISKDSLIFLCKENRLKISGNKNVLMQRLLSI